jgi:hypothetical protein
MCCLQQLSIFQLLEGANPHGSCQATFRPTLHSCLILSLFESLGVVRKHLLEIISSDAEAVRVAAFRHMADDAEGSRGCDVPRAKARSVGVVLVVRGGGGDGGSQRQFGGSRL